MTSRGISPSGFRFSQAAAKAHVMEPVHTRGVVSSRGLEEGIKLPPRALPPGIALSFNTDGFVADLNTALAANTAGYVMQLRQHGQPIASAQSGLAHRPPTVRSPGCKRSGCISPAAAS